MALYKKLAKDKFEKLSGTDEKVFRDQWAIDGLDKPRIRGEQGKDIILTAKEITAIEAEWAANAPDFVAIKIGETKETAYKKIVSIIPEWKQRNLLARVSELLEKKMDGILTAAESTKLDQLRTKWKSKIVPIRKASNLIEAEIIASSDPASYIVDPNPLWP